jgi:hypothetical protein
MAKNQLLFTERNVSRAARKADRPICLSGIRFC